MAEREVDAVRYENLGASEAASLALKVFPGAVGEAAGGPPKLPAGQRLSGFASANVAQVALPEGKQAAVVSPDEPMALETGPGEWAPIDLSLGEAGGGFVPARPLVGVSIPKHLQEGVSLSGSGVSLTPVDSSGAAVGGAEGRLDGAVAFYGGVGVGSDVDMTIKPVTGGFQEDALLRSERSPTQLSFRLGLPAGASVRQQAGSGAVEVLKESRLVAEVLAPFAQDAAGARVPVSMQLSGSLLTVSVQARPGEFADPIRVDPTVVEEGLHWQKTWSFYPKESSVFKVEHCCEDVVSSSVQAGERGFFYYNTQGLSRIYQVVSGTGFQGAAGSKMEDTLAIWNTHSNKAEGSQSWLENYYTLPEPTTLCSEPECKPGSVTSENDTGEVYFQQTERETNPQGGGRANLYTAKVSILQESGPWATFVPVEGWLNNTVSGEREATVKLEATDPGLGVSSAVFTGPGWGHEYKCGEVVQCEECLSVTCGAKPLAIGLHGLAEGEDAVKATVKDAVGLSAEASTMVRVDNAPPYNITLSGLPASHEISFGRYVIKASATDGSGTTVSSGVGAMRLSVDGKEVEGPRGYCSPGPCTASGEWGLNAENYGAGKHTLTVVATDGAGNSEKTETTFTIETSETKPVGPGAVDLSSGAYTLQATDVAIGGPGGGLSIRRSYDSRNLTAGTEGPLGPQWSGLGLGATQSLTVLPTGSLRLNLANGRQVVFAKEGSKFLSPPGDASMTLSEEAANTFVLAEQSGTKTTFTLPSGGSGTLLTPSAREEPGTVGATKYTFQTVAGITEPTEALAPPPTGVSCATLVRGCRALTFNYASSTTATGENESEWGDYNGHLTRVYFTAWDPSKSEMTTTTIAQYAYDKQGRLRAEWDPRISPALKTTYGYDSEGHVVALTYPGQQPWAFTYTSTTSDPNTGRLLKAAQALASAEVGHGSVPQDREAPRLSGTAMAGNRVGVSSGAWNYAPVTYAYQWERCSRYGDECAPIPGAVNPTYTPVAADVEHTLTAAVTAINGEGTSAIATTAVSELVVPSGAPRYVGATPGGQASFSRPASVTFDGKGHTWVLDAGHDRLVQQSEGSEKALRFGREGAQNGEFNAPHDLTLDAKGDVWVADTENNRIQEFNEKGEFIRAVGTKGIAAGQFNKPKGIAVDAKGNVWVADYENKRLEEFNENGEYKSQFTVEGKPTGVTVDPAGNLWISTILGTAAAIEYNEKGTALRYIGKFWNGEFKEPEGIAVKNGHIWVADQAWFRVRELSESGEVLGSISGGSPQGVTIDSSGNVWVANSEGSTVAEYTESREYKQRLANGKVEGEVTNPAGVTIGASGKVWVVNEGKLNAFSESGEPLSSSITVEGARGLAADSKGDLWATGGAHVQEVTESGSTVRQFGSEGAGTGQFKFPAQIAIDTKGNVWVADSGNNRIQEFNERGEYLKTVGSKGKGNGQLEEPYGVAVDTKGNIWVADTGNNRIQEFNEKGEYVRAATVAGSPSYPFFEGPHWLTIDAKGNVWVSDDTGGESVPRFEEFNENAELISSFASTGIGPAQYYSPAGIAIESKGNLWTADSGNNRLQHWLAVPSEKGSNWSPAPGFTLEYNVPVFGSEAPHKMGSKEVEEWGQKDDPVEASAIFPPDEPQTVPASSYKRGTVFYLDSNGRTVNVATPGTNAISTTEYNQANDVVRTLSPENRYIALEEGSGRSVEASKRLDTESTYNSEGSELQSTLGPQHKVKLEHGGEVQARDHKQYSYDEGAPEGKTYGLATKTVDGASYEGKETDERTTTTSYSGQENLGWKLRKPTKVTANPAGPSINHNAAYEKETGNATETTSPAGASANPVPSFAFAFGTAGTGEGQFSEPWNVAVSPKTGNVYVSNGGMSRIEKLEPSGKFLGWIGSEGTGADQMKNPEALTVDANGNIWVGDQGNERIDEFNKEGKFVRAIGWGVLNGAAEPQTCTTECKAGIPGTGNGQFTGSIAGITVEGTSVWATDTNNSRVEKFTTGGKYSSKFGTAGTGNLQFNTPTGITAVPGHLYVDDYLNHRVQEVSTAGAYEGQFGEYGRGYGQLTGPIGIAADPKTGDLYVTDVWSSRVEVFTPAGSFVASLGSSGSGNGQFTEPLGIAISAATSTSGQLYVLDAGNSRVQSWTPGYAGTHTMQTVYYSAGSEASVEACRNHPEWANLPCQTKPARQPETKALQNLPTTTYTSYNTLDEPETKTETVGTTTRTTTTTYDAAGRLKSSAVSSTVGTALPTVSYEYNTENGTVEKQSTTSEGKTLTITSIYNKRGQLVSYSDASEATTTYEYDIDGRPTQVNDGKGTETYGYDETTGLLTSLTNEYGATKLQFTAGYDLEGNLTSETYPNGMIAEYRYNGAGTPVKLEYRKTTHCTEKCVWFSDSVIPSIHGQWLEQTSTLSHQTYTYDQAGRLTQVQNTPAGKGCVTRTYAYDEDTNRTSLTTHEPNSKGECTSEGGTVEAHTYDAADRLNDNGTSYDTFGDITALPATDTGGSELTSSYYTDSQVASQTQNGQTIGFGLDPVRRTMETIATGKQVGNTTLHYAGPSSTPAWTSNTAGETVRNITGTNGQLVAIQTGNEAPELQLANLHGDIIAKAYLSETASGLASTADTGEYGVPTTSLPSKYSWLGALELPTELPSGVIDMGARSYVPQLGRFLQPDPVPTGSASAYSYTFGDPINASDPSGAYTIGLPSESLINGTQQHANEAAAEQAAINAAARAEAERRAQEAAQAAALAGPQYEGEEGGEWEEWWEEEGGYWEYASDHQGAENGKQEAHLETGVLYQPLGETGAEEGQSKTGEPSTLSLCESRSEATGPHPRGADMPCARYASIFGKIGHWVNRHIIQPAKHIWNEAGRYIARGATEAWKASGASGRAIWEVGKAGFEDWANSGVE